jgi:K+-sensing histidine kinase KdpD
MVARGVALESGRTLPHLLLESSPGGSIVLGNGLAGPQDRKIADRVPDSEIGALIMYRLWLAEKSVLSVAHEDDSPAELGNPIVRSTKHVASHSVVEILEKSLHCRYHAHVAKTENVLDQESRRSKHFDNPVELADELVAGIPTLALPNGRKTLTGWASNHPVGQIFEKASKARLSEVADIQVSCFVVRKIAFVRSDCVGPTVDS